MKMYREELKQRRTLYVPLGRADSPEYSALLVALAEIVGGFTVAQVHGGWVDEVTGKLVAEDVLTVTVWFTGENQRREVSALLDQFTRHLLTEGEQCVMREWFRGKHGGAVLYFNDDEDDRDE